MVRLSTPDGNNHDTPPTQRRQAALAKQLRLCTRRRDAAVAKLTGAPPPGSGGGAGDAEMADAAGGSGVGGTDAAEEAEAAAAVEALPADEAALQQLLAELEGEIER